MKFILILCLATVAIVSAVPTCPGCVSQLEGDRLKEAEKTLTLSLTKLAAGDGPFYKLGKINSATSQVVSGSKHVFNAELIDQNNKTKTCDIIIYSQPWMPNGIEVNFECPGEVKITKRHDA